MRDTAMKGQTLRDTLDDTAILANATVCEKQAQQKRKAPLQSASAANQPPTRRPRRSYEDTSVLEFLSEEKENSNQQLEELAAQDEKRHTELVGEVRGLASAVTSMVKQQEKQQEFLKEVLLRVIPQGK